MKINKLDDIDKKIIFLLEQDPNITHSDIAKQLSRSQPAIGARIKKLQAKGILATQIGVNFRLIQDLNLVKVEMNTTNPEEVFKMTGNCPYIINALKQSGTHNILMFLACSSLRRLDVILDRHFRNKDYVKNFRMDLITSIAKDFILPIDFTVEDFKTANEICSVETCPYCEIARKESESNAKIALSESKS